MTGVEGSTKVTQQGGGFGDVALAGLRNTQDALDHQRSSKRLRCALCTGEGYLLVGQTCRLVVVADHGRRDPPGTARPSPRG